ncbi:hypothetical protein HF086_003268 [Spodoptera exigua]|uniref:Carboxylesterase type B domain-containing protein n=1 Tax=Spodoptera exigua TaxID=7107 RepID=A0A922SFW4_SPOEX|nr:hypothetical protein HF086_003268 [Spodoptera exigua]
MIMFLRIFNFQSYLVQPNFQKPFFANDSSIYCPQVTTRFGGDLQCLRLNLYVPHTANVNSTVPVLVWFYGGGFVFGSAQDYGGEHLVKHDIIVVTVNYRLGPYGFMCLNDPSVPGNQGLKDQIGALRWVSKNIEAFGGDPTKVTIAGESYGGGAVELHLYSKYETLFHKVIIQSGSIYTPGFYGNRDHDTAIKLAHQLGYKAANTREALQILSKESSVLVMNAAKNLGLKMSACKEVRFKGIQQFVTKCINHLINPDRIENIPIMIGYNSKEDFATYANKQQEFFDNLGDIFYKNLQNHFVLKTCELETLSNITRNFYLGSKKIGLESVLELSDYSSDFKLNYAVEKSVTKLLEQGGKVYNIPSAVSRWVDEHEDEGRQKDAGNDEWSNVSPGDLPVDAWPVARHLVNVVCEPVMEIEKKENRIHEEIPNCFDVTGIFQNVK